MGLRRGGVVKGTSAVRLVDLPAFGRPVRLIWHKWRWCCPAAGCGVGSFTEVRGDRAGAGGVDGPGGTLGDLAGRPVSDVAAELGCDWHTVNRAVLSWGQALLATDCDRFGAVEALGLDETLFGRQGAWRTRRWCTSIVDVTGGQLLDIIPGRDAEAPIRWLLDQPEEWRDGIAWGTLDLSGAYRRSFEVALPEAGQVADPFHVIRLANNSIDAGAPQNPRTTPRSPQAARTTLLYRARRLLISPRASQQPAATHRLRGLLAPAIPAGEVRLAWHAKKTSAASMTSTGRSSPGVPRANSPTISPTPTSPAPMRRHGPRPRRWHSAIVNWHRARVTKWPHRSVQQPASSASRLRIPPSSPTTASGRSSTPARPNWGAPRHRHSLLNFAKRPITPYARKMTGEVDQPGCEL